MGAAEPQKTSGRDGLVLEKRGRNESTFLRSPVRSKELGNTSRTTQQQPHGNQQRAVHLRKDDTDNFVGLDTRYSKPLVEGINDRGPQPGVGLCQMLNAERTLALRKLSARGHKVQPSISASEPPVPRRKEISCSHDEDKIPSGGSW